MKITINKNNILIYICIIDLLFFPYIKAIKTSFSSLLILFIFLFNIDKYLKIRKNIPCFVLIVFSVISFILSVLVYPDYFSTNLSRLVILCLMTIGMICFNASTYTKLDRILYAYIMFVFFLAIVYFVNSEYYFSLKSFWSLNTVYNIDQLSVLTRFCGIVSDPNNCAFTIIAISAFLDNYNLTGKQKILKNISMSFIVFMTMSVSGLVCLIIYFGFVIVKNINKVSLKKIISSIFIVLIALALMYYLFDSEIGDLVVKRIEMNTDNGGGRIERWIFLVKNFNIFNYLIYGFGGTIVSNGNILNPHNGILYIIYNYGFISLICFIYIYFYSVFKFEREKLFFLFFTVNFLFNTVVIDYRTSMIYVILIAYSNVSNNKNNYISKMLGNRRG